MTKETKAGFTLTTEQLALAEKLTHLQRMTVINIVQGVSQRAAYFSAGGKAKSDNAADATVSRMLRMGKVDAFYQALIEASATSSVLTRQEALEKLTGIARGDEDRGVMQAIKQITDMQGWEEPKRTELTGEGGGPIAITQIERVIV